MNKIDFLVEVKDWFEGKFGTDPVEQSKKVAEAHLEAYVYDKYKGDRSHAVEDMFKSHFHLCGAVSSLQGVVARISETVESLLPKPISRPDIGGDDVE